MRAWIPMLAGMQANVPDDMAPVLQAFFRGER